MCIMPIWYVFRERDKFTPIMLLSRETVILFAFLSFSFELEMN